MVSRLFSFEKDRGGAFIRGGAFNREYTVCKIILIILTKETLCFIKNISNCMFETNLLID